MGGMFMSLNLTFKYWVITLGFCFFYSVNSQANSCFAYLDGKEVLVEDPKGNVVSFFRERYVNNPEDVVNRFIHEFNSGRILRIDDLNYILTHLLSLNSVILEEAITGVNVALEIARRDTLNENVYESLSKFYFISFYLDDVNFEKYIINAHRYVEKYLMYYPLSERAQNLYVMIKDSTHDPSGEEFKALVSK